MAYAATFGWVTKYCGGLCFFLLYVDWLFRLVYGIFGRRKDINRKRRQDGEFAPQMASVLGFQMMYSRVQATPGD